jgi:hypothetical protein
LLQFGICTARFIADESRFELFPFSFTIFPSSLLGEEFVFASQSSALSFLSKNHFDFNKWVYNGVPYLNHFHERTLRARGHGAKRPDADNAAAAAPADEKRELVSLNDADETWLTSHILPLIDKWLAAATDAPLHLAPTNGWRRLVCHQEIPLRRPQLQTDSEGVDRDKHIVVRPRLDEAAAAELERSKNEAKETALLAEIGVRRVFDLIAARGVPVVGHNCFLDLLFTCHTFHDGPPSTVDEFALQLRSLFRGGVFDTKRIASRLDNDLDTQLETLWKTLTTRDDAPAISLAPDVGEMQAAHDAGYDAFMTAAVFGCLVHRARDHVNVSKGHIGLYGLPTAFNAEALKPSEGNDGELVNVLFFSEFPATWSTNDIKKLFGKDSFVIWCTDNSAFVKLPQESDPTFVEWLARDGQEGGRIRSAAQLRNETPPRLFNAVHGYKPEQSSDGEDAAVTTSSSSSSSRKRTLSAVASTPATQ